MSLQGLRRLSVREVTWWAEFSRAKAMSGPSGSPNIK